MAYAQAQAPSGTFATTTATTIAQAYGANVTAGDLLVAFVAWGTAAGSATATDTQGNTWSPIVASLASNATLGRSCQLLAAIAGTTGANTVTGTTPSSAYRLIGVHEFSGNAAASPVDAAAGASGNTAAPAASVVTTVDHDLLVGGCIVANSSTVGAGFSAGISVDGNMSEYKLDQSPVGTVSVAFTQSPSGQWVASAAGFLIATNPGVMVFRTLQARLTGRRI